VNNPTPLLPGAKGSARLIAEELSSAGFASLRYDKRASGPQARENIQRMIGRVSMQGHVDELAGAVRTLAQRPFVRADRIFAVANSGGTLARRARTSAFSSPTTPITC
jgi:alpha-beta hydrolase superfamily lysophospholipase